MGQHAERVGKLLVKFIVSNGDLSRRLSFSLFVSVDPHFFGLVMFRDLIVNENYPADYDTKQSYYLRYAQIRPGDIEAVGAKPLYPYTSQAVPDEIHEKYLPVVFSSFFRVKML